MPWKSQGLTDLLGLAFQQKQGHVKEKGMATLCFAGLAATYSPVA